MFYVNKVIGWALSPLGLLFLGCAVGAVLCLCARGAQKGGVCLRRIGRGLVMGSLVLFWIFSCGVTTRFLGVPLEGEEAPLVDTLELGA